MKKILSSIALVALFQTTVAFAAGDPFIQSKFDALENSGKPIVVHIHADWCSTCKAQDVVLNRLIKLPDFKNVSFLQVDFDNQKTVVRSFKANMESTIIVFKGKKELDRGMGETNTSKIEALVKKAI